ncbi:hypothetical protein HanXRQr2_Chr03g0100671 [Helianthus annuus]|uniref:Uncharacterized protein n=1 Tax=Helianthus annuus TaxID=4232 RepID=A0A9K3JDT3_HELAN|nr:hypothetical protein HanXRQr2_Chr03g0100671 [Helianthus annuus]KAJ0942842.1 hypothetical protein HanPSC8_Chr03g0096971 [Helianthus annuus]
MGIVIVSSMVVINVTPVGGKGCAIHVKVISSKGRSEITRTLTTFGMVRPSKRHCSCRHVQ